MTPTDDSNDEPMTDPQTHLDTDPTNAPERATDMDADTRSDPAHEAEQDEGWTAEGGATPTGPATDA